MFKSSGLDQIVFLQGTIYRRFKRQGGANGNGCQDLAYKQKKNGVFQYRASGILIFTPIFYQVGCVIFLPLVYRLFKKNHGDLKKMPFMAAFAPKTAFLVIRCYRVKHIPPYSHDV
jgi:hypothetical protein